MPIYEYQCPKCKTAKELQHGMSESPKVKCPACRAIMKRVISVNSFQLKGDGWFKTSGSYAKTGSKSGGAKSDAPKASAEKAVAAKKTEG